MVSLFGFEIKRKKGVPSPRSGYAFDDSDQLAATDAKRVRAENRRLVAEIDQFRIQRQLAEEKARYEELMDRLNDYEQDDDEQEQSTESMLLPLLMAGMNRQQAPQQQAPVQQKTVYSDQEIKDILSSVPKSVLKQAKKLDDGTIKKMILSRFPNVDDDSLNRAVIILKS